MHMVCANQLSSVTLNRYLSSSNRSMRAFIAATAGGHRDDTIVFCEYEYRNPSVAPKNAVYRGSTTVRRPTTILSCFHGTMIDDDDVLGEALVSLDGDDAGDEVDDDDEDDSVVAVLGFTSI